MLGNVHKLCSTKMQIFQTRFLPLSRVTPPFQMWRKSACHAKLLPPYKLRKSPYVIKLQNAKY